MPGDSPDTPKEKDAPQKQSPGLASLVRAQKISRLGHWDWDLSRGRLVWSDEIYRIFGLKPQEFGATYEAFLDRVHPEDRQYVEKAVNRALFQRKPYHIQHRIARPDGEERVVQEIGAVDFDHEERPRRMIGTVQDITEQAQAQRECERTRARLEYLVATSPAVIYSCKPSGDYGATYISPNIVQQMGYRPEDFLEESGFWLSIVHPDDRDHVLAGLAKVLENGRHIHEYRARHQDGTYRWMRDELVVAPGPDGQPLELVGSWIDITTRRQAEAALEEREQRFCVLVDNAPGAVYRCLDDPAWTVQFISEAIEPISGYPAEDFIYKRRAYADIIHPEDRDKVARRVHEAMEQQRPFEMDYRILHRDGQVRWVYEKGREIVDPDGSSWLDGIILDITRQREAANALRESEERFRNLAEKAPLSIMTFDPQGIIDYVNQWHLERFGGGKLGPEFFLGKRITELPGIVSAGMGPELARVLRGETVELPSVHFPRFAGGHSGYQAIRAVPLFQGGAVSGGILIREDITERVKAEKEMERQYQNQAALNSLLTLAQEDLALPEFLGRALDVILKLPWLALEEKGAVFLAAEPGTLEMQAQHGLAEPLLKQCPKVPFGRCLCGRAALERKLVFASQVDHRHDIHYEGMPPHGHYCVPILWEGDTIGVLALYLSAGQPRDEQDEEFLTAVANTLAGVIRRKQADESLRKSEAGLARAQEIAHMGSWEWDIATGKATRSKEVHRIFGVTPGDLDGSIETFLRFVHPEDSEYVREAMNSALQDGRPINLEYRIIRPDGGLRIVNSVGDISRDHGGKPLAVVGTVQDITERKQAEDQLELSRKVFDNAIEGITVTDTKGNILYVNRGFTQITGYTEAEVLGKNPRILQSDRHDADFYKKMWESILGQGHWEGEIWNRRKNGEAYPEWLTITAVKGAHGQTERYVAVFHDRTDIKQAEDEIAYKANYDALTGLPNRDLFRDRLAVALGHIQAEGDNLAVLAVDLDNFKGVNNSLGHAAGDELLRMVARRLEAAVGKQTTICRLGADEFLVLIEELDTLNQAVQAALQIIKKVSAYPFGIKGQELFMKASLGITLAPSDGMDPDSLIKNADLAAARAKQLSPGKYWMFSDEIGKKAQTRLTLESALHRALKRREFLLHYQPKVDLASGRVEGMEALVRWRRSRTGLVSPAEFIPLAEETGLIVPLGQWVLQEACRQTRAWRQAGFGDLRVAVNLSAHQMQEDKLAQQIQATLAETGLPAAGLDLEVTESAVIGNFKTAVAYLSKFREMGISISLDDFGTGYSSLSYLRNLNVDSVKIDKSFVDDLPDDPEANAVAASIIYMAHSLNLKVIAEGVETREQLEFLRQHQCDLIQGYLFSKPLEAKDFQLLLEQDRRLN